MKHSHTICALLLAAGTLPLTAQPWPSAEEVLNIIEHVNTHWQEEHPLFTAQDTVYTTDPDHRWTFRPYTANSPFWDNAAYHTGNMEVCSLSPQMTSKFASYSLTWAEAAQWMGATSRDTAAWRYTYGEKPEFVLFGDWQICFQTYCDLYLMATQPASRPALRCATPAPQMIERARNVMEYEMSTTRNDYWWWADGLYMVMPVMTKLYRITGDEQYLAKLLEYWTYSKDLMYDGKTVIADTLGQPMANEPQHLFYRDGKYLYPKHRSMNGRKDFWARGCGWVVAGLAKVLQDVPQDWSGRQEFLQTYLEMCQAVRQCQQPEGYWTRSLLDPEHAPGPETSGTAFFTYGLLWGVNHGLLAAEEYLPCIHRAWHYLTTTALQEDYSVGYVQPIGERAIPGQTVNQRSTANFGTGAFLLAASEMYRMVTHSVDGHRMGQPYAMTAAQASASAKGSAPVVVPVGMGYSQTSVNATIFRNSSLATHGQTQYAAYYDAEGWLTLAKRQLGDTAFVTQRTQYRGNVNDAHNVIAIMPDGEGRLHVAFDHHGHPLHYARAIAPGSLTLGPLEPMISDNLDSLRADERDVTYPEFYRLSSGNLLFAYRTGVSGRGNLVLNRYDIQAHRWSRLQDVLISGEEQRNAYWQLHVDRSGTIHVSWVWRETWMVETNHDLCYACSHDEGRTWQRSDGTAYTLPITAATAEYACRIPQRSELINQTSMSADAKGHPYIATYWRAEGDSVPQYRIVWHDGRRWQQRQVSQRHTPFTLAGGGTKMIPIARPRVAIDGREAWYIVRDAEQQSRACYYYTRDLRRAPWELRTITPESVDAWEPSFDTELWQSQQKLHLLMQCVHQGDGERTIQATPTPVAVIELIP